MGLSLLSHNKESRGRQVRAAQGTRLLLIFLQSLNDMFSWLQDASLCSIQSPGRRKQGGQSANKRNVSDKFGPFFKKLFWTPHQTDCLSWPHSLQGRAADKIQDVQLNLNFRSIVTGIRMYVPCWVSSFWGFFAKSGKSSLGRCVFSNSLSEGSQGSDDKEKGRMDIRCEPTLVRSTSGEVCWVWLSGKTCPSLDTNGRLEFFLNNPYES